MLSRDTWPHRGWIPDTRPPVQSVYVTVLLKELGIALEEDEEEMAS